MKRVVDIREVEAAYAELDQLTLSSGWNLDQTMLNPTIRPVMNIFEPGNPGNRANGMTNFYRVPVLQEMMMEHAMTVFKSNPLRVLVLPGSIGCEALTCSMIAARIDPERDVEIHSLDRSKIFTDIAKLGVYQRWMVEDFSEHFQECADPNWATANDNILERVTYLPPADALGFETDEPYDLIFMFHFLQYLNPNDIIRMMDLMTAQCRGQLAFTLDAGDRDGALRRDRYNALNEQLSRKGVRPVNKDLEPDNIRMALPPYSDKEAFRYMEMDELGTGHNILDCSAQISVEPV